MYYRSMHMCYRKSTFHSSYVTRCALRRIRLIVVSSTAPSRIPFHCQRPTPYNVTTLADVTLPVLSVRRFWPPFMCRIGRSEFQHLRPPHVRTTRGGGGDSLTVQLPRWNARARQNLSVRSGRSHRVTTIQSWLDIADLPSDSLLSTAVHGRQTPRDRSRVSHRSPVIPIELPLHVWRAVHQRYSVCVALPLGPTNNSIGVTLICRTLSYH